MTLLALLILLAFFICSGASDTTGEFILTFFLTTLMALIFHSMLSETRPLFVSPKIETVQVDYEFYESDSIIGMTSDKLIVKDLEGKFVELDKNMKLEISDVPSIKKITETKIYKACWYAYEVEREETVLNIPKTAILKPIVKIESYQ